MHTINRTLSIPPRLKTSLLNYLNFFREYATVTLGITPDVRYAGNASGTPSELDISLVVESEGEEARVVENLRGYVAAIFHDRLPEISTNVSHYEAELFLVLYKRALADIRTDIRFYFNLLKEEESIMLVRTLTLLTLAAEQPSATQQNLLAEKMKETEEHITNLRFPSHKEELPSVLKKALDPPSLS
jgi:hypothetical protein